MSYMICMNCIMNCIGNVIYDLYELYNFDFLLKLKKTLGNHTRSYLTHKTLTAATNSCIM